MLAVVIGAGIVGLHVARLLQEQGHEVFVLEQERFLAEHTSGRNSGVIHSGVFYKTGSFKEAICIEGNRLTYEWVDRLKVAHWPCGKWVVPEEGQESELEPFLERIRKLPIPTPSLKSADEVASEEPHLRRTSAIFVPSTGILDAAGYVKALAVYLENKGVQIIMQCQVLEIGDHELKTTRGEIPFDLAINSAGLFCDEIAEKTGLSGYTIKPCRGDYYLISKNPVKRPVYHLPYPATSLRAGKGAHGLGVHLTPTIDNQLLLGPNAFFIEGKTDYDHKTGPADFEKAVQFYLPKWNPPPLSPAYSGNRPKLFFKGEPLPEFTILKQGNWIHLLGIESPGLTSAPALANHVAKMV
ncbi:MAG: NAD(P)/FAD-dependent oxidoreductase [Deltaproteobacteria bacterium]|nr:NAD(P)/FAD-dependent oxidoreductase [Deltaproteobacteria bacterium]